MACSKSVATKGVSRSELGNAAMNILTIVSCSRDDLEISWYLVATFTPRCPSRDEA